VFFAPAGPTLQPVLSFRAWRSGSPAARTCAQALRGPVQPQDRADVQPDDDRSLHRPRQRAAVVCPAGRCGGSGLPNAAFGLFGLLPDAALLSWGWRMVFTLLGLSLWVPSRIAKSPEFEVARAKTRSRAPVPARHPVAALRATLVGILAVLGPNLAQSELSTHVVTFGTTVFGLDPRSCSTSSP
jgi:hypothetical protein